MREKIRKSKRWVIKLGTSSLTDSEGRFSCKHIEKIVTQTAALKKSGYEVIMVSSGAIALGMEHLGLSKRPKDLPGTQACAAIGQGRLMAHYEDSFSALGLHTAQVLLTRDLFHDRKRYVNAKNTLNALLKIGIIPVINENDTVATEEIKFGDNDMLSAQVANLVA